MNKLYRLQNHANLVVPGDTEATLTFSVNHFIRCAEESLEARGCFMVALSGGSTPKAIYQALASPRYCKRIDWTQVSLFWSDERTVLPTDAESNYRMAMDAGLAQLPIPKTQIFRMQGELDPERAANQYEESIAKHLPNQTFDLIMLGMGEDGHIASLFPYTKGLMVTDRSAIANYVPQKSCWRLTLTFEQINRAHQVACYVMGSSKARILAEVLQGEYAPDRLPAQRVGTSTHPCLWIADTEASKDLVLA